MEKQIEYCRKYLDNSKEWNEYMKWIEENEERFVKLCKLAKDFEERTSAKKLKNDRNCRI